jgi:N-acetylmuramic acid 6-phosphate etherase
MSASSRQKSQEFLKVSHQFQLGALVTESSHPFTAQLSETAQRDIAAALNLLFDVDADVLRKYREFVESGRAVAIKDSVLTSIKSGGRIFFTGCGSTGRLSIQLVSIWRDFWQRYNLETSTSPATSRDFEHRAFSVMAGGDFALIKSVEGFEDFTAFGRKQLEDLGVCNRDVVFAITEGGETSFVIGTAWKALEADAKVYFVYNNPDEILCRYVQRSREVIDEPRIEKINLTTGPMAITGSTRMQATTIQLCVLLTVLEMVIRDLLREFEPHGSGPLPSDSVPAEFLASLSELHQGLKSDAILAQLAGAVSLEESAYSSGHKNNYFADHFGIDVLTDTTERSPTYCTPPFRKFDDPAATESWAFLFVPEPDTPRAWQHILKREPNCIAWTESDTRQLVGEERVHHSYEVVRKIGRKELMRFRIGLDGLQYRPFTRGDCAVGIVSELEKDSLLSSIGFHRRQLEAANQAGASTGVVYFGSTDSFAEVERFLGQCHASPVRVLVPVPKTNFLLDGITRVGVKMVLNALSTCIMVRLGRVMGNFMVWVVASNLKLIDRATRYIQKLTALDYAAANDLLFEVVEYVEPRMKSDQAYPPVVGLAVTRARYGLGNEEAEKRFASRQQS